MTRPLLDFEQVRALLKQRFPYLMVDTVIEIVPGERILASKNVTGNELQFLGHFPDRAIMPGTLIVESFGQAASILFSRTHGQGESSGEFLVLGVINNMQFLAPVVPGDRMLIEVRVLKLAGDIALVEGSVRVGETVVAKGKITFGRSTLGKPAAPPPG